MAGISLVSPPPGQPFDILTQQAQLQKAQDLAYALLMKELGGEASPTIRTAAGNPFGRDVVNLSPIGDVLGAVLTQKRLGGLNTQQQDLAQQVNQRYLADMTKVQQAMQGEPGAAPDVMGEGAKLAPQDVFGGAPQMVTGAQPGSLGGGINEAMHSLDPRVQALGQALMAAQVKFAGDQALTPERLGTLSRNVDPASIAAMQRTGPFGFQYLPGGAAGLAIRQTVENQAPGTRTVVVSPSTGKSVVTTPTPGTAAPADESRNIVPPSVVPPETTGTGAPGTASPSGEVRTLEGPLQKTINEATAHKVEMAQASQARVQDFKKSIPEYQTMAQIALRAREVGNFGALGPLINDARKLAAQVGVSQDDQNKITDYETFMKYALPAAVNPIRGAIGARVSTIEFTSFLSALGATGDTSPRTLLNIMQQKLYAGVNDYELHKREIIPALEALPPGKAVSKAFHVSLDPQRDVFDPMSNALRGQVPVTPVQDPNTGMWRNAAIPGGAMSETGLTTAPNAGGLPPGWKLVQ